MPRNRPTMTSLEAAALYMSGGATTDPEQATLMQDGKLLDPDRLQRAGLRRAMGFDFTVLHDEQTNRWTIRDEETKLQVSTPMSDDDEVNSERLSRACLKLKRKHDQYVERQAALNAIPEGETVDADD